MDLILSRRNLFFGTAFILLAAGLWAGENDGGIPVSTEPPLLSAPIYLLADADSGEILLEQNIHEPVAPASLAKLMTLHLAMEDIASGRLSPEDMVSIPYAGSSAAMRPGSSILGLRDGEALTVTNLMKAAAVASANDAAWSLALLSSPNERLFVERMNQEALNFGMSETEYVDPDGWSSLSTTTAANQFILARKYIERHPQALENFHSVPEIAYKSIEKPNTNLLIDSYPGADGLKTGTIPSAGFHFLATAKRESTRFIAIVMGIRSSSFGGGLKQRAVEAAMLLDWGFANWRNFAPPIPEEHIVPVLHGSDFAVAIVPERAVSSITIPVSEFNSISALVQIPEQLEAPLVSGTVVGEVRWYASSRMLAKVNYVVRDDLPRRWRLRHLFK